MRYWSGGVGAGCRYVGSNGIGDGPGAAGGRKSKLAAVPWYGGTYPRLSPQQLSKLQYPPLPGMQPASPSNRTSGKRRIVRSMIGMLR